MSDEIEIVTSPWYRAELLELSSTDRERVADRLRTLGQKGWRQAMQDQTVKYLRDGIHEVRILGRGAAYRLLFFLAPGRVPRLVVLTTCVAKSETKKRRRMEAEIERASTRRAWWIEQQRRKEEEDGR